MKACLVLVGLILARIPVETIDERTAYFRQRNSDQMEGCGSRHDARECNTLRCGSVILIGNNV